MNKQYLKDLTRVGPQKPMGYLPQSTIVEICGEKIRSFKTKLKKMGLKTKLFAEHKCIIESGALYAYDEYALAELLKRNKDILRQAGWPIIPEEFINMVATKCAQPKTRLFDLIADAFADYRNGNRLSNEKGEKRTKPAFEVIENVSPGNLTKKVVDFISNDKT